MEHGEVELTGVVEYVISELDSAEYGPVGAAVELHLMVRPSPVPSWRGLWRSDFSAPEVIIGRTIVNDTGYITLGIEYDDDLAADVSAVRSHLAKTNQRWLELGELGQRAATEAAALIAKP